MSTPRRKQLHDHRLVQFVQRTRDISHATGCGVAASTARGWLARDAVEVISHPAFDMATGDLRVRLARLEARLARLGALIRIALALLAFLRRVLARVDISFSNSLIQAWWRSRKHTWLFLHPLDTAATVRREVAFYVEQHNTTIPHSAFRGQTPDEMYFGRGDGVPYRRAEERTKARTDRTEKNRAQQCAVCA